MTDPVDKTLKKEIEKSKETKNLFPIVGIGASAGGLEALEQFFENMPSSNGMAFVVIQHLDPNHDGMLPELLQRSTPMKVIQAGQGVKVKPDQVYIIPPGKSISLKDGELHLSEPVEKRGLRLPVDLFLRSLADDREEKSIAVILSGMGSDGSLGIKAIKEKNGIVLVQEPSSAKFDSMPRNAIQSVVADIIAPVNELPSKLLAFLKVAPKPNPQKDWRNKSGLEKIVTLLRDRSGNDFSLYKKSTLIRRIERRKGVHQINSLPQYIKFIQENPNEIEILNKELLIGVSSFFRDSEVWEMLQKETLPELISQLPEGYELRAWVPACSTGEEAYSLAIVYMEAMEKMKNKKKISLQIFATDPNHEAIEMARKGFYHKNISADVSPERLRLFFRPEDEGYRVNNIIREMVIFATQNVIKDPPFTKIDILSCRNMLIYMETELQKKIISLFNYSLKPGGILILGIAESPRTLSDGLQQMDGKYKIYRRTGSLQGSELNNFPQTRRIPKTQLKKMKSIPTVNLQSVAEQILLQHFAPSSVMVNEKGDILYITGHTGKYLEPAAGKANWNIYAMARDELRNELPGAFRSALQSTEPVVLSNLKMGNSSNPYYVNVTIQQINNYDMLKGLLMIIFTDIPLITETEPSALSTDKRNSKGRVRALEIELKRSQEELGNTRLKMQTAQEELKSINEELQSSNEELQSTNEELTTSKEEMQSMNEELQTVNTELQSKINDFMRAEDDMKNLLNSTEIAALFLDREMNVRRFTTQVTKIFKLRNTDIGRPITDLATILKYPDLGNNAQVVIKTLVPFESTLETNDHRWFDIRIMPYRTVDDRIDGVVITFSDVTKAKKLEQELKAANEKLIQES